MEEKTVLTGFGIVIADRGFVYVGDVEIKQGDECKITNAKNIRRWGTDKGLGQLALEGPQEGTTLDDVGVIRIPWHAYISLIETEKNKWIK